MTLEIPSEWVFNTGNPSNWRRVFENGDISEIQPVDLEDGTTRKFKWVYADGGDWGIWEGTEPSFEQAKREVQKFADSFPVCWECSETKKCKCDNNNEGATP